MRVRLAPNGEASVEVEECQTGRVHRDAHTVADTDVAERVEPGDDCSTAAMVRFLGVGPGGCTGRRPAHGCGVDDPVYDQVGSSPLDSIDYGIEPLLDGRVVLRGSIVQLLQVDAHGHDSAVVILQRGRCETTVRSSRNVLPAKVTDAPPADRASWASTRGMVSITPKGIDVWFTHLTVRFRRYGDKPSGWLIN